MDHSSLASVRPRWCLGAILLPFLVAPCSAEVWAQSTEVAAVVLGELRDTPEIPVPVPSAVAGSGDEVFMASFFDLGSLYQFGLAAEPKRIGRAGEGPGEYRDIRGLSLSPDGAELLVADGRGRVTALDPATLEVTATTPVPLRVHSNALVALGSGLMAIGGPPTDGAQHGAVYIVARDGTVIRTLRTDEAASGGFVLRAGGNNSVWVVPIGGGPLRRLDPESGDVLESVAPEIEWFELPRDRATPPPGIIDLVEDAGVLWLSVRVRRESSGRPLPPTAGGEAGRVDPTEIFSSVLVAVDREAGSVLGTTSIDSFPLFFLSDRSAITYKREGLQERLEVLGFELQGAR